jgi:hypothetical protein
MVANLSMQYRLSINGPFMAGAQAQKPRSALRPDHRPDMSQHPEGKPHTKKFGSLENTKKPA